MKHARLWVCTCPPALHAGNPPGIPCVPCIGNVNDMPSILYQHWHRKVYRKFFPVLYQDMSWKFSTILHKDWCRIYGLSCTSIAIQESVQEIVPYTIPGYAMEILNCPDKYRCQACVGNLTCPLHVLCKYWCRKCSFSSSANAFDNSHKVIIALTNVQCGNRFP